MNRSDFRNNRSTDDISYRCLQSWEIDDLERQERERQGYDDRVQPTIEEDGGDPYDPANKPLYVPPSDPKEGLRGLYILEL